MNTVKDNMSGKKIKIRIGKYRSYTIGSLVPLSNITLDRLIDIFEHPSVGGTGCLEGRAAPRFASLPEVGPVVVKYFKRGGWLARFNRERYFRTFKTRSRKEFEFLLYAAAAGVPVPAPVAFASRGGLVYRAWLVTGAITDAVPFVRLCRTEKDKALSLMPEISRHISVLIQQGIHHVDLHPGNIIVGKDDKPYIVDFDKARYCIFSGSGLAGKYQRRWIKAVRKYNLPDVYTDLDLTDIDR